MTDKEKRELKDNIINLFNRFNILDHASTIGDLRDDILRYIDSLQEEPAEIDFEQELYNYFGQVKDFTLGMRIAKRFYDMGKNSQEPVSEVWHDMSESVENGRNIIIIDPADFYGAVLRKGGSQLKNHNKERYVKWAYLDDLLNLSNVERIGKDWKEPVSEDLSAEIDTYIKDNFTIDKEQLDRFGIEEKDYMYSMDKSDILTMVKYFTNLQKEKDIKIITDVEAVAFANGMAQTKKQIEESVSENLEEAALEYANNQLIKSGVTDTNCPRELAVAQASLMVNGFKAGTKWQKEQDKETIELAEDHAMLAGMEKMKQEMMKDAVDGKVIANGMGNPILHLWDKGRHLIGKKVKVIVFKSE